MEDSIDNNIEFVKGGDVATCSFTQSRWVNKMRTLAESHPDEVQIVAENDDGSILCHFPVSWLRITPKRHVSDELREISRERMTERNRISKNPQ